MTTEQEKHSNEFEEDAFGGDDEFPDDFSDDLSEETVGFEDETVVYDDDSPIKSNPNPLSDYKRYIAFAFSMSIIILLIVLFYGKKKDSNKKTTDIKQSPPIFAEAAVATESKKLEIDKPTVKEKQPAKDMLALPKEALKEMSETSNKAIEVVEQAINKSLPPAHYKVELNKIYSETKMMNEQFREVQNELQTNRSSFLDLSSTLSTLESSVRQANASLIKLDEKIMLLKNEMNAQQAFIDKLKEKNKRTVKIKKSMEMLSKPRYRLYAAIPGRAWLKSNSGNNLTVALGSNIPGYGIVTAIDPIKGVLVTGKGHVFQFDDK